MTRTLMKKCTTSGLVCIVITLLICIGGFGARVAGAEAEYVMKLAHGVTLTDPLHPTAEKFKELIEEYTNGRVQIGIYPNSQLGDEQEIVQSLRTAAIELSIQYSGNVQALAPSIGAIMLPYMYTTSEEAWCALDAVTEELNKRLIKEAGIRILGFYEKGFRVLTNSKKEIKRLDDLKGLKIRVSPTDIPIETFKAWGLNPIPMAWAEVFTALQQKVVDGQENPYTTIPAFKFDEVQKYVTEIHYMLWTGPLLVSERYYQGLPEDIQQALLKAGKDSATWEREFAAGLKQEAIDKITKAGMVLSGPPEDEDEWQKRAQAIWPNFYDTVGGKEWADQVQNLIKEKCKSSN